MNLNFKKLDFFFTNKIFYLLLNYLLKNITSKIVHKNYCFY